MRINFKIILAVLVIVGVAYWAYDSVRVRNYSGAELTFDIGNGPVTLVNSGEEAVPLRLTNPSTRGAFTVSSSALEEQQASVREGSGRSAVQAVDMVLPSGTTELQLVRGSGATATLAANSPFEATVYPQDDENTRSTLTIAAIVVAAAVLFILFQTRHMWMRMFQRGSASLPGNETVTAGDIHA